MNSNDNDPNADLEKLHEQALQHLGRRLFAEAREQSDSEDAEFEARRRARLKTRDPGLTLDEAAGEGPPSWEKNDRG